MSESFAFAFFHFLFSTLLRRHGDGFDFHVPIPAFADVLEKIGMERHYLSHRSKVCASISTDPLCLAIIQSLLSYLLRFDLRKIGAFEARCFFCCLAVGSSWGSSWQMQTLLTAIQFLFCSTISDVLLNGGES